MSLPFRLHSFPRLLLGSIALAVGLLVASGFLLRWSWVAQAEANRSVASSYEVIVTLKQLHGVLAWAESSERGYVLTGSAEFLEAYERGVELVSKSLMDLATQTAAEPEQRGNVAQVRAWLGQRMALLERVVRLQAAGRQEDALAMVERGEGRPVSAQIHALLDEMESAESDRLFARRAALARVHERQVHISFTLLAAEVAFAVFIVVLVYRVVALRRMVTVCAWSKQIKVDGKWLTLEQYLGEELQLRTTHGISPEMAQKMMADFEAQAESRPPTGERTN